ncbi:hypothetical protein KR222_004853 [Zaprionus bogoriensis]|nr:hypothetical protein KR222_004853 [Zaprionus bogoriensis]
MKTRSSFFISSKLFDNRRLKRHIGKWMDRLHDRQKMQMASIEAQTRAHTNKITYIHTPASKTEHDTLWPQDYVRSEYQKAVKIRVSHIISLFSSDDEDTEVDATDKGVHSKDEDVVVVDSEDDYVAMESILREKDKEVECKDKDAFVKDKDVDVKDKDDDSEDEIVDIESINDDAEPVEIAKFDIIIDIDSNSDEERSKRHHRKAVRTNNRPRFNRRSPPPLAPLTFSKTVEDVTVSLVPRSSTTASRQTPVRQHRHLARNAPFPPSVCKAVSNTSSSLNACAASLRVDVCNEVATGLPDETTVHTIIANRTYELSLSKLREGLATSGEYANHMHSEQLQKLSPAMRAKVAPMVAPSPPPPISLKLSSDLTISLISDDEDSESGSAGAGAGGGAGSSSDMLRPVVAAHAAAKLLKQQQPQLSVVQHLQYPGDVMPVALPVMAHSLTVPPRIRRKLG